MINIAIWAVDTQTEELTKSVMRFDKQFNFEVSPEGWILKIGNIRVFTDEYKANLYLLAMMSKNEFDGEIESFRLNLIARQLHAKDRDRFRELASEIMRLDWRQMAESAV